MKYAIYSRSLGWYMFYYPEMGGNHWKKTLVKGDHPCDFNSVSGATEYFLTMKELCPMSEDSMVVPYPVIS